MKIDKDNIICEGFVETRRYQRAFWKLNDQILCICTTFFPHNVFTSIKESFSFDFCATESECEALALKYGGRVAELPYAENDDPMRFTMEIFGANDKENNTEDVHNKAFAFMESDDYDKYVNGGKV